jgi:hypothetical protein
LDDQKLKSVNDMVANQGPEGVSTHTPAAVNFAATNGASEAEAEARQFVRKLVQDTISHLNSGDRDRVQEGLSSISAVIDQPGVAKAFIEWGKDNYESFLCEDRDSEEAEGEERDSEEAEAQLADARKALVKHLSNPTRFLELEPALGECIWSRELLKEVEPRVNTWQSDVESLADHFYERFRKATSSELRQATSRFLCELDVEKLVPTLALHLNNQEVGSDGVIVRKEFSIEERTLIASVLGHQAKYSDSTLNAAQEAAGALFDQIFPKPYGGFWDCVRSNLGRFSFAFGTGLAGGAYLASFVARVLPKSIFVTPEIFVAGTVAGAIFACRLLYKGIPDVLRGMNELVVKSEDQHEDVRLAAARGLADMLSSADLSQELKQNIRAAIGARLDKTAHGEVTAVLREALEGPGARIDFM